MDSEVDVDNSIDSTDEQKLFECCVGTYSCLQMTRSDLTIANYNNGKHSMCVSTGTFAHSGCMALLGDGELSEHCIGCMAEEDGDTVNNVLYSSTIGGKVSFSKLHARIKCIIVNYGHDLKRGKGKGKRAHVISEGLFDWITNQQVFQGEPLRQNKTYD